MAGVCMQPVGFFTSCEIDMLDCSLSLYPCTGLPAKSQHLTVGGHAPLQMVRLPAWPALAKSVRSAAHAAGCAEAAWLIPLDCVLLCKPDHGWAIDRLMYVVQTTRCTSESECASLKQLRCCGLNCSLDANPAQVCWHGLPGRKTDSW